MILYNFFKYLFLSIKYNRIIKKVYADEGILQGLSKMFGTELRSDWIGRVYTVINPHIVEGKYDPTTAVYELGSDSPTDMAVEKFIMERLNAARQFIRANNLFDLLTYKIERLDEYDNYLFIMYPIPYVDLAKWSKWMAGLVAALLATGGILWWVL